MEANSKKWIFYAATFAVAFIATGLICFFALNQGVFYSVCWGLFAGMIAAICARIGFHLIFKDNSPEMWQVSIYLMMVAAGWLIAVLGTTWTVSSIGLAMCVGFILMALGTRLIKLKGNWIHEKVALSEDEACQSLRWKFINDNPSEGEDYSRALCAVNGTPLTIVEAETQGYVTEAISAREYLRNVIDKKEN